MSRLKDKTLSIRTSAEIKQLLRMAAEHERRSVASMIEVLVLEYARTNGLKTERNHEGRAPLKVPEFTSCEQPG